jgi:protein ImuB
MPGADAAKDRQLAIAALLEILHKWGIHTVGEFARLKKDDVAARLGVEGVRLWERATGKSTRLLKLVQPPESFAESFEFEREIETAEPVLFMLRRFLEQLAVRLAAIYLVAKELTLRLTFENKQIYERVFKIPQPTNDVDLLFRMLHTHLENFKSEYPIVAVALSARPIKSAREQFGLFETTLRNPHQLSETLARLTALLSSDRVGSPVLEETHRPDAFRIEPFLWHGLSSHRVGSMPSPRRALRRFRPNISASVLLDEEGPIHLRGADVRGKIIEQRGPFLISGNWWDEKSWARAEWDLELEDGQLVLAHQSQGAWKLDGVYD